MPDAPGFFGETNHLQPLWSSKNNRYNSKSKTEGGSLHVEENVTEQIRKAMTNALDNPWKAFQNPLLEPSYNFKYLKTVSQ